MNNNKFMDGLLWGLLIGGTAVFLFGTKKGNKLLKIITEEGADSLNKIVTDIEDEINDFREENIKEVKKEENTKESFTNFEEVLETNGPTAEEKARPKRFFKSKKIL